jgi:hypothetical protein
MSKQMRCNKRILEVGHQIDHENANFPEFFVGSNSRTLTVAVAGMGDPDKMFQPIGGILWRNEGRQMSSTTRLHNRPDPRIEREVMTLATVHNALARRHLMESGEEKRTSQRTVIFLEEAERLQVDLSAKDIGPDSRSKLWEAYHAMFVDIESWIWTYRPQVIPDSDPRVLLEWKESTMTIAIGGDMLFLEDGTELSGSSEGSEPDEATDMNAPGCRSVEEARLTEEHARILHARERSGGHGTG